MQDQSLRLGLNPLSIEFHYGKLLYNRPQYGVCELLIHASAVWQLIDISGLTDLDRLTQACILSVPLTSISPTTPLPFPLLLLALL